MLAIIGIPRSHYTLKKAVQEANDIKLDVIIITPKGSISEQILAERLNATFVELDWTVESILKHLRLIKIELVISLTEFNIALASEVRQCLNLPGEKKEIEDKVIDKFETRKAVKEAGLSHINFSKIDHIEHLSHFNKVDFPFILKPLDLTGSIGVFYVEEPGQIDQIVREYANNNFTMNRSIIIEQFIVGEEVSVEGLVVNGVFHLFTITDKRTTGKPNFMEKGHTIPSQAENIKPKIKSYISDVIKALGIECSPIHAEVKICKEHFELVEIHTRYGGDMITRLIFESYGYSLFSMYYKALLNNESPKLNSNRCISSIEFFMTDKKYVRSCNLEKLNLLDCEVIEFTYNDTGSLRGKANDPSPFQRLGYIIFNTTTHKRNLNSIKKIYEGIEITTALEEG